MSSSATQSQVSLSAIGLLSEAYTLEGLSIDETHLIFADGFGIRKAARMLREKQELQKQWKSNDGQQTRESDRAKARETAHLEFGPEGRPTRGFRESEANTQSV